MLFMVSLATDSKEVMKNHIWHLRAPLQIIVAMNKILLSNFLISIGPYTADFWVFFYPQNQITILIWV